MTKIISSPEDPMKQKAYIKTVVGDSYVVHPHDMKVQPIKEGSFTLHKHDGSSFKAVPPEDLSLLKKYATGGMFTDHTVVEQPLYKKLRVKKVSASYIQQELGAYIGEPVYMWDRKFYLRKDGNTKNIVSYCGGLLRIEVDIPIYLFYLIGRYYMENYSER
jgi:hypothetical protein